MVIAVLHKTPM